MGVQGIGACWQGKKRTSKDTSMVKERHSFDSRSSPKLYFGTLFRIVHEENHRMGQAGKDHCGSPGQTFLLKQSTWLLRAVIGGRQKSQLESS